MYWIRRDLGVIDQTSKFVLYLLTFPDGMVYVGETNDFDRRMKDHEHAAKAGRRSIIYAGVRHHGWANVRQEIIGKADTRVAIRQMEKAEILRRNCRSPNGYNSNAGGSVHWPAGMETSRYVVPDWAKKFDATPEVVRVAKISQWAQLGREAQLRVRKDRYGTR